MTTLKRARAQATSHAGPKTRAEIERLVVEIREMTLHAPGKAAKILSNWIRKSDIAQTKKKTG